MVRFILLLLALANGLFTKGQITNQLVNAIKNTNAITASKSCSDTSFRVISHRAMNIFMADKTSYLSAPGDLSYFTNYVTLNSRLGLLTINHNFQKASGLDEPLRKLFGVGVNANVADGFNAGFLDKQLKNSLGLTITNTWIGKVKTTVAGCDNSNVGSANVTNQKQAMDAIRMGIVYQLQVEINQKDKDLETAFKNIDSSSEIPGQNIQAARSLAEKDFYTNQEEEYQEKFARLQAEALTRTNYFKRISTHWTTVNAYVPLVVPKHLSANSLTQPVSSVQPYNAVLTLSHTRMWEGSKTGRVFLTIYGKLTADNTIDSWLQNKTTFNRYRELGGTDTMRLAIFNQQEVYLGKYKTFITPTLSFRAVYFSPNSHVGLSFYIEKNFSLNNRLNARVGIPVVLINSKRLPALNIEFQLQFYDLTSEISNDRKLGNNPAVGIAIGVPFSRLMY